MLQPNPAFKARNERPWDCSILRQGARVEWDSADDALAFYKSKPWTDLAPQRDESQKTHFTFRADTTAAAPVVFLYDGIRVP
jgi:hypothetical protein